MSFVIHDKTKDGRKKMKEGPKAQEKYCEELASEWIDNHATKDPVLAEKVARAKAREAQIPEAVKARALRHEQDVAERMGLPYDPGKEKLVADVRDRQIRRDLSREEFLLAKMSWEISAIGYVRDATQAEADKLGLALPA